MSAIERFLNLCGLAARQTGYVARHLQGEVSLRTKKAEKSPEGRTMTTVHLAAQDVILSLLHSTFAESAVNAEEQREPVALFEAFSPGGTVKICSASRRIANSQLLPETVARQSEFYGPLRFVK